MRACMHARACVCACVHEMVAPKRKTIFVTTAEETHLLASVDEKWAWNSRCMCALKSAHSVVTRTMEEISSRLL